jgi:hypothetical protein
VWTEVDRLIRVASDLAERASWPRAPAELKSRVVVELARTVDRLLGLADEFHDYRPWWVMRPDRAGRFPAVDRRGARR